MERSAFEAIMIGVNVFVFIIALTAAVMLMTNITNMVNYANENIVGGMNGSLAETVGVVHERTYTGYDMLNYYKNVIEGKSDSNFLIKMGTTSNEYTLRSYIVNQSIRNYMNETFELQYKGKINEKDTYVFILKTEDIDE